MRRMVLVVCLLMLFGTAAPAEESRGHHGQIEGTWLLTVYFPDGTPLIAMLQNFTRDGRTTLLLPSGIDEMIGQPVSANQGDSRSGCMGDWRLVGERTFDVTMYCLWRQNPGLDPDRIRFRLTLGKNGETLEGPFKYMYADPLVGGPSEYEFVSKFVRLPLVPLD